MERGIEVPMGSGVQTAAPELVYTKNIGTCMGLCFYKRESKEGALYHIGGSEDWSVDVFGETVHSEVKRLESGIYVCFVSGFAAIDSESQRKIKQARARGMEILGEYGHAFSGVEKHFCMAPGQYISYFGLDCRTGRFDVKKMQLSKSAMIAMDREADALTHFFG